MRHDKLKVGMSVEARSPNPLDREAGGEWFPALITELPRSLPGHQLYVFVAFKPSQTAEDAGVLVRYPQELHLIGGRPAKPQMASVE